MRPVLIFLLLLFSCAEENLNEGCVDLSKAGQAACYANVDPVCGCNGTTYSNECIAKAAGVLRWTKGECSK